MGVLYYIERDDLQLFALNKAYHYFDMKAFQGAFDGPPVRLADVGSPDDFARRMLQNDVDPEWKARIAARLYAWAGDRPIRMRDENNASPDGESYKVYKRRITGSAHDSDYKDDGMTYKPGSAW